jgi:MFS family permease
MADVSSLASVRADPDRNPGENEKLTLSSFPTGIGMASNLTPLYISEISPPAIRGQLVGMYEIGWQIGGLVGCVSFIFSLFFSDNLPSLPRRPTHALPLYTRPGKLIFAVLTDFSSTMVLPNTLPNRGNSGSFRSLYRLYPADSSPSDCPSFVASHLGGSFPGHVATRRLTTCVTSVTSTATMLTSSKRSRTSTCKGRNLTSFAPSTKAALSPSRRSPFFLLLAVPLCKRSTDHKG